MIHFVSGEATRKGFYSYDNKRKPSPDPELYKYIEKSRSISGVAVDPKVRFVFKTVVFGVTLLLSLKL